MYTRRSTILIEMMKIDLAEVEKDNCNCPVHDGDNDNNLANEHLIKRQRSVRRKQRVSGCLAGCRAFQLSRCLILNMMNRARGLC